MHVFIVFVQHRIKVLLVMRSITGRFVSIYPKSTGKDTELNFDRVVCSPKQIAITHTLCTFDLNAHAHIHVNK